MSALAGRVAVVTGASRGIGLAIADACWDRGAHVVAVSRTPPTANGERRTWLRCDVSDWTSVEQLREATLAAVGVPDAVVHAAGIFRLATLDRLTADGFAEHLAINLQGAFHLAKAFLPGMRKRGSGRLINLGSVADHRAFAENAAYSASKYGLRGLHEVLREEYRGSGVLCTLLSPGPTDTPAWDPIDPDHREGFTPRAKMLRPEDVAEAVLWVATRPQHVDVDWIRLGPA
jgi:NAD(P)-dependent dehydrogenase (short-subunit alcohol dehydrogenase family)